MIAPAGAVYDEVLALTRDLAARQAEIVAISTEEEPLGLARLPLRLPVALPEWLSPFTCVVPGQLLALHVTLAKGYDPDHPRGLTKVTKTESGNPTPRSEMPVMPPPERLTPAGSTPAQPVGAVQGKA